jgi:hypothetical protein
VFGTLQRTTRIASLAKCLIVHLVPLLIIRQREQRFATAMGTLSGTVEPIPRINKRSSATITASTKDRMTVSQGDLNNRILFWKQNRVIYDLGIEKISIWKGCVRRILSLSTLDAIALGRDRPRLRGVNATTKGIQSTRWSYCARCSS